MQTTGIVTKVADLPDLSQYDQIVIDTETSGVHPFHGDRICGISIGPLKAEQAWYIPVRHHEGNNLPLQPVRNWLQALATENRTFIGHNIKFDLTMFRFDQIEFPGPIFDTMIAAHVLNSDRLSYDLERLTAHYVPGFKHTRYVALQEYLENSQVQITTDDGKSPYDYSKVPIELLGPYALEDIEATRLLRVEIGKQAFKKAQSNHGLRAYGQKDVLFSDMDCVKAMFEMQWMGVPINRQRAVALRDATAEQAYAISQRMFDAAGCTFNPAAYTQMTKALEKVGGRVMFWMKKKEERGKQKASHFTENKAASTERPCFNGIAVIRYLEKFKEENNQSAYDFILNFRELQTRERVLSAYIDTILQVIDNQNLLHAEINLHRVVTGRLSISRPSLQNQPKKGGSIDQKALENFLGTKDAEAIGRKIRSLFVAPPGYQLVSTDLSQVEYRAAAYFSRDPVILEKYRKDPKTDYHQATADLVGIDRDLSKTINFMVLYGGAAGGLAATLTGMGRPTTKDEAKALLNKLYDARPMLRILIRSEANKAAHLGYVQNPFGRVMPVPSGLDYVALNYLIQSTCADLLRAAMVRIFKVIKVNDWPVVPVLTIHDELQYLIPTPRVAELAPLLAQELCKCDVMDVPLLSDIEVGTNWGDQIALSEWLEKRKDAA